MAIKIIKLNYSFAKNNAMKKYYALLILIFSSVLSNAQLVINELDSDTPGQDFEEFIELKSDVPHFALDGYVVVLFNGSDSGMDSSYFSIDLDGYETDVNGILTIGSSNVSPVPELLINPLVIQNGADAVAVYLGSDFDFPEGTPATTTNLIDALIYDTDDPDDTGLMALLGISIQINENENNNGTLESIQRNNDGTYSVTTPTPGALNDGSGVDLNGISFTTDQEEYTEGDLMTINFTTEFNVTSDLTVTFNLDNGSFDTNDFSGSTVFTIPTGTSSAAVQFQLLEDGINDGDEFLEIDLDSIPEGFNRLRDNVRILVTDLDFTMAPWGNPLNPTYDQVQGTVPAGYYNSLNGLAGDALKQELQNIITSPDVRAQTYADAIDILKEADQNPGNSNEVWLFYTEQPRAKILFQDMGGSNVGLWNREHTYPRSRGGFYEIEYDQIADGRDIFVTTSADSIRHGISDGHGLRATDGPENSARNNKDYGEYSGPTGNLGSWKGDAARAVMFMAVRYNNLALVYGDPPNTTVGELGDLSILLQWNIDDPVDDYEMNRNNVVYTWQFNRNPFIDRPELVAYIFGALQGEIYNPPLGNENMDIKDIKIYPNPTNGKLIFSGISEKTEVKFYSTTGSMVFEKTIESNQSIFLPLPSGIYLAVITNNSTSFVRRIIVN